MKIAALLTLAAFGTNTLAMYIPSGGSSCNVGEQYCGHYLRGKRGWTYAQLIDVIDRSPLPGRARNFPDDVLFKCTGVGQIAGWDLCNQCLSPGAVPGNDYCRKEDSLLQWD
ncbi:hypothetical protein ETB97_005524 [Aspergillus alliaceus]|uniref:Uncharacterized protein n=1 Tax=Petromyces alliaceus TaxID=209559 RepID=A0A8H6E421_PETAA|nr:hypothetical protein ETB97_005524 [Aspergillus burnettii]